MAVKTLIRPLIAAGFFSFAAARPAMLECRTALPEQATAGEPVMLQFDLVNHGKHALWVLDWNTPIEGLRNRFLLVRGPGGEVPYRGPMFKRGQPGIDHYHEIAPGMSLHAEVDLSLAYRFAEPGRYHIRYIGNLLDVVAPPAKPPRLNDAWHAMALACPERAIDIKAR